MATKVTKGDIQHEVGVTGLQQANLEGGRNFPLRYAVVTRVDEKRMVVDLRTLSGPNFNAKNVPLTFPNAGARHFLGAIPEVGDLCLIGQSPAESGRSKRPIILGWFVPSTQAGYDWLNVRSHAPDELGLTPKQKVVLEGLAFERRHKLRQMERGNVVASSSQGSDLLLTESATLTNRRGNELSLRDQDQALVVRTLQQFHAGAGFRTYSGMVQRDANLLPSQVAKDTTDWTSGRQVDGSEVPLTSAELDENEDAGSPNLSRVFDGDALITTMQTNPREVLKRGLLMDDNGTMVLGNNAAVYGGKPMFRVASNLTDNAVNTPNVPTLAEYRIEVAHTSDGVLPVTEQTDGLDVDRLLQTGPPTDPDAEGGDQAGATDPTRLSPNVPMVEFILGTAVGNDAFGKPSEYGIPLVAKVTTESGDLQTVVRAFDPAVDDLGDQLAFLIRSRDPRDFTRESFFGLTKGGAWVSSLQGQGSKVAQENLRTGKVSFYGRDTDGHSRIMNAEGAVAIVNTRGRQKDNVGVEIRSSGGAVDIFGGGPNTAGAADGDQNPNAPANTQTALSLRSAKSALLEAKDRVKVSGSEVVIGDTRVTSIGASSSVNIDSGDTVSVSTKVMSQTVSGQAEYVYGGPKDSAPTNGPLRSTKFTGTPLTGATGGVVDELEVQFGGRSETFLNGRLETTVNVGSFNVRTMAPSTNSVGPGSGFSIRTGPSGLENSVSATPTGGVEVTAGFGSATVQATKGQAKVSGVAGATLSSLATVGIKGSFVRVTAPGPSGGVITDGCIDGLTGRSFLASGTLGAPGFRLG